MVTLHNTPYHDLLTFRHAHQSTKTALICSSARHHQSICHTVCPRNLRSTSFDCTTRHHARYQHPAVRSKDSRVRLVVRSSDKESAEPDEIPELSTIDWRQFRYSSSGVKSAMWSGTKQSLLLTFFDAIIKLCMISGTDRGYIVHAGHASLLQTKDSKTLAADGHMMSPNLNRGACYLHIPSCLAKPSLTSPRSVYKPRQPNDKDQLPLRHSQLDLTDRLQFDRCISQCRLSFSCSSMANQAVLASS